MKVNNYLSTLIVLVSNKPGVLFKIAGVIRRRRFNIESLTVSHTQNPEISRFTILVRGDRQTVEKATKQLNRIVEIIKVSVGKQNKIVARVLGLYKVSTGKQNSRTEINNIVKNFRAKVVNIQPKHLIIEITGDEEKIDAFGENMKQFGIIEFAQTGRTALSK